MKKIIKISAIILGILGLVVVIWIALILFIFSGSRQYVPNPVYSEDGKKMIIPTINYSKQDMRTYLCVYIEVRDTQSQEISYRIQTYASDRMRWSINWIGEDIFRLDSSDIGSYCWKEINGNWGEAKCP